MASDSSVAVRPCLLSSPHLEIRRCFLGRRRRNPERIIGSRTPSLVRSLVRPAKLRWTWVEAAPMKRTLPRVRHVSQPKTARGRVPKRRLPLDAHGRPPLPFSTLIGKRVRAAQTTPRPVDVPPNAPPSRSESRHDQPTHEDLPSEWTLAPRVCLPSFVVVPAGGAAPPGSGLERCQAAALAERLLTSMRVGEISGSQEVRLKLRGLEVRLRVDDGSVRPTLVMDEATPVEARAFADRVEAELQRSGLDFSAVEVS